MPLQNWARNLTYSAARIHRPNSVDELRDIVLAEKKLRVLGSRHSFNTIADSPAALISTENLTAIEIDAKNRTVMIGPGITYGKLCPLLHAAGFALHNLASLPHISVAGAIATATHGSGNKLGNLATAVASLEILTASGEMIALRKGDPNFAAVVHLGALGVVTKVTLDLQPAFTARQIIYEKLPFAELEKNFDAITSAAYSVSMFTSWTSDFVNQVWLKQRLDTPAHEPKTFFGALPAPTNRHPIMELSAENCTAQMSIPGPWHERIPHFRMEFTPSNGDELQAEYFVPRHHAVGALRAINKIREEIASLLMISELRTIAADEFWMSPCYQTPCLAIHFTLKPDRAGVLALLPKIESALAPFSPRPHWGKFFTFPASHFRTIYPKLASFIELARSLDPAGKFRNPLLDSYL